MEIQMTERLLDSVILIDHLNGINKATRFVTDLDPQKTAISVITRTEILVGVEETVESLVKAFLDQYRLLPIDKPIADLSATLRREYAWKLPDAFQAALAKYHRIKLTTRNTKDFDPRKHDFVEVPYSI
jgi:predicted nucleic acid-binding protein